MTKHRYPWQNPDGTFKDQENNVELFHGSYSPQKHKALEALRGADEKIEMDKIQELENEQFDSLVDDLRKAEKEIDELKEQVQSQRYLYVKSEVNYKNTSIRLQREQEEIQEHKFNHELEVSNLKEDLSNSKISRNVLTAGIIILTIIQLFF